MERTAQNTFIEASLTVCCVSTCQPESNAVKPGRSLTYPEDAAKLNNNPTKKACRVELGRLPIFRTLKSCDYRALVHIVVAAVTL